MGVKLQTGGADLTDDLGNTLVDNSDETVAPPFWALLLRLHHMFPAIICLDCIRRMF